MLAEVIGDGLGVYDTVSALTSLLPKTKLYIDERRWCIKLNFFRCHEETAKPFVGYILWIGSCEYPIGLARVSSRDERFSPSVDGVYDEVGFFIIDIIRE